MFSARALFRTLFAVALLVWLPTRVLCAQTARSATVGVIGGFSLTTLAGKDAADDLEGRTGILAGLSVVFSFSSRTNLEVDGLYTKKGFRSTSATSTFDFVATYIEVPLLLRIDLAPEARVRPFLSAGPAFSARFACEGTTTTTSTQYTLRCDELAARSGINVMKTDLSGVISGGLAIPAGRVDLTLATRYTIGFSSVIGNNDNHNRALSVYFGLARARSR
ncbi:MAG: porin family protein [Gemmatimonas sp.]